MAKFCFASLRQRQSLWYFYDLSLLLQILLLLLLLLLPLLLKDDSPLMIEKAV